MCVSARSHVRQFISRLKKAEAEARASENFLRDVQSPMSKVMDTYPNVANTKVPYDAYKVDNVETETLGGVSSEKEHVNKESTESEKTEESVETREFTKGAGYTFKKIGALGHGNWKVAENYVTIILESFQDHSRRKYKCTENTLRSRKVVDMNGCDLTHDVEIRVAGGFVPDVEGAKMYMHSGSRSQRNMWKSRQSLLNRQAWAKTPPIPKM